MKQTAYGILFFATLIGASCHKDEYQKQNPCYGTSGGNIAMDTNLLNYRFKTGTYWVFVDSTSTVVDSLYITSHEQGWTDDPCNLSFQYHQFSATSYPSMKSIYHELKINSLTREGSTIYYSFNHVSGGGSDFTCTHYDSLYIFNQYYHNVAETIVPLDLSEERHKSIYYMNAEFGFLRIDNFDSNNIVISQKFLYHSNIIK
ncbi:MAG: hypothetical protein ACHQNT_12830 [Bacteroidia bacterium]